MCKNLNFVTQEVLIRPKPTAYYKGNQGKNKTNTN